MQKEEALKKFINQIAWLYEAEFGDFKRKVGLYIERLEEAQPGLARGPAQQVLANMKSIVMYNPNGDIEHTRRQILQLAHELLGSSSGPLH